MSPRPEGRRAWSWLALAALAIALTGRFEAPVRAAVALSAVAPLGASAGVVVQITGSGFDAAAANNTVTLTLPGGASASLIGETIAVVDAAKGIRRVGVTIPAGLPTGTASVVVTNRITAESAGGRTLQIVSMALPEATGGAHGAQQIAVRITGSSNVQFVAGRTTVTFGPGIAVAAVQVSSPTVLVASLNISSSAALGPRTVNVVTSTQTQMLPAAFSVTDPNRPPAFTSAPGVTAEVGQPYTYQAAAADPDNDPVTFRLVSGPVGLTVSSAGLVSWTPGAGDAGDRDVLVEAADGRGGTAPQSFRIAVASPPQVVALEISPASARLSAAGETRPLSVSGRRSDGQTVNLSAPSTGTTYESSNRFVATVSPEGTVSAIANGDTTVTARNGSLSAAAAIAVEIGVTLQSLQLTPAATTLRAAGATGQLALRGSFSDGSSRDLTGAPGTSFVSSNQAAATVGPDGLVTAIASGQTTITARHDGRDATATVAVSVSGGGGFLRGEAFDDSRGLPLGGAIVTLVSDGGGAPASPVSSVADDRGRFTLPGRAGEAVVRSSKPGYTAVERHGVIPVDGAATLLDARLTPLDARANAIGSALGGTASDTGQRAVLRIGPGGLPADASITLTPLGPQGLEGVLPRGWSPIAAVAIEPGGLTFGFPLSLTLTHALSTAPAGLAASLVRYDRSAHQWVAIGAVSLDAGGLTLTGAIGRSGTFAVVMPDAAPVAPPAAVAGQPLAGLDQGGVGADLTAAGDVVPRSAPPGDDVRAVGRFALSAAGPISSGTIVQVHVSERFDLLDATQVHTLPFTQDLIAYATPRPSIGGIAGAVFPITPSRSFSIQELMLGVVRLDVQTGISESTGTVIGSSGGPVTNEDGDTLTVPAGALAAPAVLAIRRRTAADIGVTPPAGFTVIAAMQVDAVGVVFGPGVEVSTNAAGVTAGEQVLVTRAFTDAFGQRRLRLIALADLVSGRLVSRATIAGAALEGIRGGGELVFLRALQPIGFLRGTVVRAGGAPVPSAVVTTDALTIADAASAAGEYVVPASVGPDVTIRAIDPASGDTASAVRRLSATGEVLATTLTVAVVGPTVVAVSPAAGATNVALDTPVAIDFSEPLDPASLTGTTAAIQLGSSMIAAVRTLSADRRRVVIRPAAPLSALSTYTIVLTGGIQDNSGNPLTGYTPATFTTLDPSRPPPPAHGRVVAELPDEGGLVLVTGAGGVAGPGLAVVVTNIRTQESSSVQSLTDGSFHVRIGAIVGDELLVTFRGTDGRDVTLRITQFAGTDGAASVGVAGGTFADDQGRVGSVLPRGLSRAGIFRIDAGSATGLPALPGGFTYADAFEIETGDAAFRTLTSLTLSESQNRFAPAGALALPFSASGSMTVPVDALTSSALQFSAVAQDADGTRRTISGATTIVASGPNRQSAEVGHAADFPTLFLASPREAVASEQVEVSAVAPAARVDLLAPRPATVLPADTVLLVQPETFGGAERLIWVDRLVSVDVGGAPHLRTAGRDLPGITSSGSYALLATHDPLVFATGIASGPESVVVADGLPVAFRTRGPNGRFILPVRANQGFTVRFFGADGQLRGTATGQAPSTGSIDLGNPLGASAGRLTVRAEPDERAVVDIGDPIVLTFSEPVDATTVASALVITDPAGVRVFGRTTTSADGLAATFEPNRRWRYGTRYRFGVGVSLLARSGARPATPFTGEFTTFEPAVIGVAPGLDVRDVAAAGATALAATATGFSTVDVSAPRNPVVRGSAVVGGAGAIASLAGVTLTDRAGTAHAGPFALVAAGGASAPTVLHTFDVANPAAPVGLGATQLSSAPGGAPPPGVPAFAGVPRAVAANSAGRGFVAMQSAGVSSVDLGQAMPPDPSNPARGAGPRYPAGAESAGDVVAFGNRLAVAGVSGLTVLDQTSLARVGGISTTGDARGVAVLEDFPVDLNGDGILSLDTETLDVAAVANGIDGTLQLYQVSESADPVLISTVRFQGSETTAVKLDRVERLAYVGLGSRGLALVDLAGRPSVQPVDEDHDGVDDRVLGNVDTPGTAQRLSLDLSRGLVFVADGAAGLTVARVLPARTRLLSLVRDPVLAIAGEEESIAGRQTLFVTDDALRVTVDAIEPVLLAIEEQGTPATPMLRFPDARTVTPLPAGLSSLDILVDKNAPASEKTATLTVLTAGGQRVARVALALRTPALAGLALESLRVGPGNPAAMTSSSPTLQLGVAGYFADGSVYNLTSAASGTTYATSLPVVAEVDGGGLVTGHAGGIATVVARNDTARDAVRVRVDGDRVLTSLRAEPSLRTLRTIGEELAFPLVATFSDGAEARGAAAGPGVAFTSTDASIASVDAAGRVRALSAGVAEITAARDTLSATLTVAVDPRTPSTISGIALAPPPAPLSLDDAPLFAVATVTGTGALDGLPVQVSITRGGGSSSETVHTDMSGAAVVRLDRDAEVGSIGVTASITDPASGAVRSDSRSFVIAAATGDVEPNDPASPAPLSAGRTAAGSVDPVGDPQDTYVFESTFGGTLQLDLRFAGDPGGSQLVVVIRDQEGRELARIGPIERRQKLTVPILPGAARITVEGIAGTARYALTATLVQAPVSVGVIVPMGGPPGTLITIDGGGFSSRLADNLVFFSGIPGEVVSATPTRLQVRVPAAAPNGAVEVISGDRRVDVGGFVTGQATRPSAHVTPNTAANVRRDPVSGALLDINRLLITVVASATTADVEALAVRLGGRIAGFFPFTAQYVLEFPANQTFDGLNLLRQRAAQEPQVRGVGYGSYRRMAAEPTTIDIFDRGRRFGNNAREWAAHEQIGLREAITLVRSTPPFIDREGFNDVRVAVIDSGFNPGRYGNEFLLSTNPVVEYLTRSPAPGASYQATATYTDTEGRHGTQVTSVLGAVNDGRTRLSGVMNSFFDPLERPLPVHVYRAESLLDGISTFDEIAALDHIRARTPAIDVINLSFGSYSPASTCTAANLPGLDEAAAIAAFRGRTLIVASAGNDGVDARCHFPSALSRTEPHVVSVGATATDSGDRTPGEQPDDRAIFTGGEPPSEDSEGFRRCSSLATDSGSNCGPSVTIAAPGEDILPLDDPDLNLFSGLPPGTSLSAPIVSSIAAILQSIRPGEDHIPPSQLRSILTSTATAVMGQWNPDPRLKGAATPMARLNALAAVEAVLRLERSDAVYVADRKALGTGTQQGTVVVVNVDPVTGTPATGPGATTTIDLTLRRAGDTLPIGAPVSLVTSRDGGRLYVFASAPDPFGDGIAIVDGTSRRTLAFVPLSGTPFPLPAGATASRPFRNYLPRPPMALSRDGRLLYVATGTGIRIVNALSGRIAARFAELPGDYNTLAAEAGSLRARLDGLEQRILALGLGTPGGANISALELSPDGRTLFVVLKRGSGTGAQPGAVVSVDVDLYTDARPSPGLQSRLTSYLTVRASTVQSGGIPASDEPADAAITPDGQRLYIVNSGINSFSAHSLSAVDQQVYAFRVVHQGTAGAPTVDPNLVEGVTRTLADGVVVLHAPGTIDVFKTDSLGDAESRYQSDVNFGWWPSAASGGLVMSPGQFGEVFAKRPATLAIRPDGRRALVAYAQTGNFGVLDVESQQHFRNPDARVGAIPGVFSGVVGVTPAVPMDKHLVPTTSAGRLLQFPTQIEYAQNGRFAAATHAGAVSVISDRSIDEDLRAHAGMMEPTAGGERAYFSQLPICASRLPGERRCERDVHTSLFEFVDSDGATKPFVQPLGIAVAPIVELRAPRFGDHITRTTAIHVRWGHPGVIQVRIEIFDLGSDGLDTPVQVGSALIDAPAGERSAQASFASILSSSSPAISGHRYRIEVIADSASGTELSRSSVDVTVR